MNSKIINVRYFYLWNAYSVWINWIQRFGEWFFVLNKIHIVIIHKNMITLGEKKKNLKAPGFARCLKITFLV